MDNVRFLTLLKNLRKRPSGEVATILIWFLLVFSFTDYHILDKLFELCTFMKAVMLHENLVDSFSQLIHILQGSSILTSLSPYQSSLDTGGHFDTTIYFTLKG